MITYLLGDFLPYILGALGLVAAFFGIRWGGGKAARQKARAERAEANNQADRRMDDADVSRGDPAADDEWLRKRDRKSVV